MKYLELVLFISEIDFTLVVNLPNHHLNTAYEKSTTLTSYG